MIFYNLLTGVTKTFVTGTEYTYGFGLNNTAILFVADGSHNNVNLIQKRQG